MDIGGLFVFFGAAAFIFLKFVTGMLSGFKGTIIRLVIAIGLIVGATYAGSICAPLATILAIGAVIIGGFLGTITLFLVKSFHPVLAAGIAPIEGMLMLLIILTAAEFVVRILSIFVFIPFINIIVLVLNIAIPIAILLVIWVPFSSAFSDLATKCLFEGGRTAAIPGTGGIHIGTVD